MPRRDVVIVGAGPGGLASAMLLAQAGCKVRILERRSRVGGRTSAITTPEGFRFDLGPTFFLYPRVLNDVFAAVGRSLMTEVPMVRLDPQYRLIFGSGGRLDATPNVELLERAIASLNVQDSEQVHRYLSENREKLAAFRPILESPFHSWKDLLKFPLLKLLPLVRPWNSLDRDLKRYFRDPRVRLAFSFQSKYLGMSPFRCPSLFSILSFLEYEYGVFHPYGGCSAVSDRMAEIAREMGVEISLDEPVEKITFEGRRARAVVTPRGTYNCDALLINADFAAAMGRLIPNELRPRWTDRKLAQKKYSCSTYMMYLGIRGQYDHLAHHTIYIAKDYNDNLKDIEQRHVLSADPSLYVQNACVTDPELAPRGHSTLYVLAPVTHQHPNVDWRTERLKFRETVLQQLERLGLSDLRERIVYEKIVTPLDWQDEYEVYRGATFNLAHNLGQMLHLRPQNRFGDLDGVYLTGGGTHPGSGLPVIYESARISSRLICEEFGLSFPEAQPDAAVTYPVLAHAVS